MLYSVNTIVPIFLIVVLGWILKNKNVLDSSFFAGADKFVFNIALPTMLFLDLAETGDISSFNFTLVAFCIGSVLAVFVLLCVFVPLFCRDNAKRGAAIQGIYRSNFAILGTSVVINMFGDAATGSLASVLPVTVITFNVLAVIALSVFAPKNKKLSTADLFKTIILNIVKNPLIIALVIGILFLLTGLKLPTILDGSLGYISDSTLPLALMSLGANIEPKHIKESFLPAIISSLCKTVIVPLAVVTVAALIGFRGIDLGVILILFSSPTAVSSYIMAKTMGSDHNLASQILLYTTVLSVITMFIGIFIVKSLGLI